mgnify:CR=1 FL=1
MEIELQAKLLKLKGQLNEISHISFSYSRMEKQYPLHSLDENTARQLIKIYEDLLSNVKNLISVYGKKS